MEVIENLIRQTAFFQDGIDWRNYVMILVAFIFLYLAIKKGYEPLLLLPIAFGMLLANIYPLIIQDGGLLNYFFKLDEWSILPSLIFLGVGAMTDFGPLIANPKSFLLGAAAQFGIFAAYILALLWGFNGGEAAAVSIIGGADGPTSIFLAGKLQQGHLMGSIAVAAYSYMSLVPIIQPPIMKLLTTKKEREIKMEQLRPVSKLERILFPIIVTVIVCLILPSTAPLVGMLMLGNLFKESGVVGQLTETASNALMYIVVILLGTTSLDEILADEEVKGVFVSVSPEAHFSIASKVLENGKALFIEKPPCLSTAELKQLTELQKRANVLAVVDLQKRFAPAIQILKKELQRCKGTKTYNLKYLTGAYPEGDSLFDLFIHPLDCVTCLFGKSEVRGMESINGQTLMLMFKHADATGILELSTGYTWSDAQESMTINTDKGVYTLEQLDSLNFRQKPHCFCGIPLEKVFTHKKVTTELFGRNKFLPLMPNNQIFIQGYYGAIKSFADAVEGNGASAVQSLEAFMETYSLMDAIRSFNNGESNNGERIS